MNKKLNINKTVITLIILNIIQIGTLLSIIIYSVLSYGSFYASQKPDGIFYLILIIIITTLLNSFISIRDRYLVAKADAAQHIVEETLSKVENLNNVLRAQRHDFLNHLQVVYGLMEMDEYRDARDYIERVYNDIQSISRILKTANPAVNALLQAKLHVCENKDIQVTLNVTTQLKGLGMPSWEMCRVLGNLIDNAIDALDEKGGNKILVLEIFEDLRAYGFRVSDNGSSIASNIVDKIFEAGFTTKGNKGEGMGLAITKEILSRYKGNINVHSAKELTTFEVNIPK